MLELIGTAVIALFCSAVVIYRVNKRVRAVGAHESVIFALQVKIESLEHQLRCVNARIKRLEKVNNIAEAIPISTSVYADSSLNRENFNACMG